MPCVIAILAVLFPRFLMICIAIFTSWFGSAFQTWMWPLLGFLFLPYTTLAYMAAMLKNNHNVSGGWLVLVVVAVLVDLGGQGTSARHKVRKQR